MGEMLTEIASWLGRNPEVLIFLVGLVLGYILGKR